MSLSKWDRLRRQEKLSRAKRGRTRWEKMEKSYKMLGEAIKDHEIYFIKRCCGYIECLAVEEGWAESEKKLQAIHVKVADGREVVERKEVNN